MLRYNRIMYILFYKLPHIRTSWDYHPTFMLILGRVLRSFTHLWASSCGFRPFDPGIIRLKLKKGRSEKVRMKRNILLKIILITVTIGALLAAAAVVKKNADNKIKVPEKNSAAVETIQTKKATESNLAELKESKEQKESELDFAEQKEYKEQKESDLADPEESNEQADSGTDIDIKEQEEYGKPDSEGKSDSEEKSEAEEKTEPEEKPEPEKKPEPEVKPELEEKQEPAITDSPYDHEIYLANGVLQYGENSGKAQMGKDVNTGSTVECPYPMEVMTTRVMYNGHYGYHTYKGYYKASDKTDNIECMLDAAASPLFNIDTVMFQGVMGIYRCGSVVFTCLGIVE